jgi:hypothetical protein
MSPHVSRIASTIGPSALLAGLSRKRWQAVQLEQRIMALTPAQSTVHFWSFRALFLMFAAASLALS